MADDLSSPPSWFTAWAADVRFRSGIVTRRPVDQDPLGRLTHGVLAPVAHALCGRFDPVPGTRDPNSVFESAPWSVRLRDDVDHVPDAWLDQPEDKWAGTLPAAQTMMDVNAQMQDTGHDLQNAPMLPSLPSLSVPWWAYVAGAVVGYGALVQVGILPPLNKLLGSHARNG
jgi:hypothetical protein